MSRLRGDDGNAMVEFVYLAVLLMVPLVYIMLAVFDVQRASFGVTEAARQAGRTFVTECGRNQARAAERARDAAALALADQGYTINQTVEGLSCPGRGGSTDVTVKQFITLPGIGALVPRDRGGFTVSATFVAVRDEFAP